MNAVETTLNKHLEEWGLAEKASSSYSVEIDGVECRNVRIEQAYKGNFHLLVDIDGKERKFVIGKNKPEYSMIQSVGVKNLSEHQVKEMIARYI